MTHSIEALKSIGGQEWQKGDYHRVYFNNLPEWFGLKCEFYNSGSVASATLDGRTISNSYAKSIINDLRSSGRIWYDVRAGKFVNQDIAPRYFDIIVEAIEAKLVEVAS